MFQSSKATFTSSLMQELLLVLEFRLKHTTLRHRQIIGLVERSHTSLKTLLKLNTIEQWNDWNKYASLAKFIHNTFYHSSIACCPNALIHEWDTINPLDLQFVVKILDTSTVNSDYVSALQDVMLEKFKETKSRLIASYRRYPKYYDQKKLAQILLNFTNTAFSTWNAQQKQISTKSQYQFCYNCNELKKF